MRIKRLRLFKGIGHIGALEEEALNPSRRTDELDN